MEEFNADRTRLNKQVTRGLELYVAVDAMRGAIEQSLGLPGITIDRVIQTCLAVACNSLLVAFDFGIEDTWTICVFQAKKAQESDMATLHCIAHARKIQCELTDARTWQEGVGFAGVSYSMSNEIIIPDMLEQGTIFKIGNPRPYDSDRYRSMVIVPIIVGPSKIRWGVAVVTSNRSYHFNNDPADGVRTSEPIRAIAAMTALAVQAMSCSEPGAAPQTQNVLAAPVTS
jgi:hypothetical protein